MGAPLILFDEVAAFDQLRAFVVAACAPEVRAGDVYRSNPAASPTTGGRPAVVLKPLTVNPVYLSPFGAESDAAQRQRWSVAVTTAATGAWTVTVLGTTTAPFVAVPGDTAADIVAGLQAAVDLLGLAVATEALTPPPAAFGVLADVAGVSLGITVSAPVGGAYALTIVDDNIRRAVYNWGVWRVRFTFRDVPSAERYPASGVRYVSGALAERTRLWLQASSLPVTNGSAYPYRRDQLQAAPARLSWLRTGNPTALDVQEDGAWVRQVVMDIDFQTPVAMTHDVPSLDQIGLAQYPVVIDDP